MARIARALMLPPPLASLMAPSIAHSGRWPRRWCRRSAGARPRLRPRACPWRCLAPAPAPPAVVLRVCACFKPVSAWVLSRFGDAPSAPASPAPWRALLLLPAPRPGPRDRRAAAGRHAAQVVGHFLAVVQARGLDVDRRQQRQRLRVLAQRGDDFFELLLRLLARGRRVGRLGHPRDDGGVRHHVHRHRRPHSMAGCGGVTTGWPVADPPWAACLVLRPSRLRLPVVQDHHALAAALPDRHGHALGAVVLHDQVHQLPRTRSGGHRCSCRSSRPCLLALLDQQRVGDAGLHLRVAQVGAVAAGGLLHVLVAREQLELLLLRFQRVLQRTAWRRCAEALSTATRSGRFMASATSLMLLNSGPARRCR
jgi:hypothetical protein